MEEHSWSVDDVMAMKPCYSREKLEALWAGRERLSVRDVAALDIPASDRLWLLLREGPHVQPAIEKIVTRAVKLHALHCDVPAVAAWAQCWLNGDRDSKAAGEAEKAARAAARAAALAAEAAEEAEAAWAAAAAAEAAWEAAWAAAWAALAAGAAEEAEEAWEEAEEAWEAAAQAEAEAEAAWEAERELQIQDVLVRD